MPGVTVDASAELTVPEADPPTAGYVIVAKPALAIEVGVAA